jgi:predicted acylesterase/phospholipase RssA
MLGLEVNVISAVSGGAMTAAYYVGSRDAQFSVSVQPSHLLLRR